MGFDVGDIIEEGGDKFVVTREGVYSGTYGYNSRVRSEGKKKVGETPDYTSDPKVAQAYAQEVLGAFLESSPNNTSVSRYTCIVKQKRKDGKEKMVPWTATGPCHSALNRCLEGEILAMATSPCVDAWKKRGEWGADRESQCTSGFKEAPPKFEAWWHYLVNESPWAKVFLTKDLKEAEERGVVIDVSLPANFSMQGIIATRHPHEFPNRVELWYDAVQKGGDPLALMPIVEDVVFSEVKKERTLVHSVGGDIHDMFRTGDWNVPQLKNYLNGRLIHRADTLQSNNSFRGIHRMYGKASASPDYGSNKGSYLYKVLSKMERDVRVSVNSLDWGGLEKKKEVKETSYERGVEFLAQVSRDIVDAHKEAV